VAKSPVRPVCKSKNIGVTCTLMMLTKCTAFIGWFICAPLLWRLFDFDRAISMKSGLRPAGCGCSGIVSGVPNCAGF
jgi:hypothetical protein